MQKMYVCWVEIHANREIITDPARFRDAARRCKEAGINGLILSVKDPMGFVLYPCKLAHHYSEYDETFAPGVDYAQMCFGILREEGLKCYAAFDVFAEGSRIHPHPAMRGFREGWDCQVYGLNGEGKAVVLPSTKCQGLRTVSPIDDFGEIFVNPGNPEVRAYELALMDEFAAAYQPDGIVLDRARYVGLSTDFSECSRLGWEAHSGCTAERWPEDIYTIEETPEGCRAVPGKHYGSFFAYRSSVIKGFIEDVAEMLHKKHPQVEFCDYTGSWYPLYDQVGANWASAGYVSTEFPHCDPAELQKTAYGEIPDWLMSGFYYEDVWMSQVEKTKPAYWYSVEGSYKIASQATCHMKGLMGGLYLEQYKQHRERLTQAITLCLEKSGGCMLFDLSHIVKYGWWEDVRVSPFEPLEEGDLDTLAGICGRAFPAKYGVTREKIRESLLRDPAFAADCSFKLRDPQTGKIIGFLGAKISNDQALYPNTAWISLMVVDPPEQNRGWGRLMLLHLETLLREKGIEKVHVGQDFQNFFSGIPEPSEEKAELFRRAGYILNDTLHYDLEAELDGNQALGRFDPAPFEESFRLESLNPSETELLLDFVDREFPGRWHMELKQALEAGKDPEQAVVLWDQKRTKILGYCLVGLDPQGRSGLGPIGIAKEIRGNHVGDYLLYGGLTQLKKLGASRVNIDWTILVKFYGQFDFLPERTYLAAYQKIV